MRRHWCRPNCNYCDANNAETLPQAALRCCYCPITASGIQFRRLCPSLAFRLLQAQNFRLALKNRQYERHDKCHVNSIALPCDRWHRVKLPSNDCVLVTKDFAVHHRNAATHFPNVKWPSAMCRCMLLCKIKKKRIKYVGITYYMYYVSYVLRITYVCSMLCK